MAERRMYYRLPTEGAANVFESEHGPIEYLIIEAEEGDPAPDGWVKDHLSIYAGGAADVSAPVVKATRGRPRKVQPEQVEPDGDGNGTDDQSA